MPILSEPASAPGWQRLRRLAFGRSEPVEPASLVWKAFLASMEDAAAAPIALPGGAKLRRRPIAAKTIRPRDEEHSKLRSTQVVSLRRRPPCLGARRRARASPHRLAARHDRRRSQASDFPLQPRTQQAAPGAEGRYLLRTNLVDDDPARLWNYYLQLVRIEGLLDIGHFNGTAEPSRLEIGAEIPELERHVGLACGTFSAISGDTPAARRLRSKPYLRRRRQTQ